MAPLLGPHGAVLVLDPQGKVGVVYLDFQLLAILILGAERKGDAVEGPNIGIFGPFDLMPDQKTMQTSFCYVGTKTFTYSHKN